VWDAATTVLLSAAQTFGVAALGFLYGRLRGPETRGLTDVTMTLFVPALALTAIMDAEIEAARLGQAALAVLVIMAVAFVGGFLVLRLAGMGRYRGLLLPIVIVNSANLPFPLLEANFGPEGLSLGILCYVTTNVVVFTLGIAWMAGRARPDLLLREPAFLATVLAVGFKLVGLRLPAAVAAPLRLAGQGAIPAMLAILGQTLAGVSLGRLRVVWVAVALRYLLGLAGALVAIAVVAPQGLLRGILLFYGLLPSAVVTTVLARRYDRDAELVASTVLVTTLLAVPILPLVLALLRSGWLP
jgi:hypothetical protein